MGIVRLATRLLSAKRTADEYRPKFVNLAPTDKADDAQIYSGALDFATNDPNVSNIALTGPYGSGKSSVIKTFLTRYKRPHLQISLAAFLPEADDPDNSEKPLPPKSTVSKQEIERSILQQMLYGADANNLPLSRFKRIQAPKWWARFVSLFIIVGLFACWNLFVNRAGILNGDFFEPLGWANWFNLASFLVGVTFLWQMLHYIYVKSFGFSLKSISLKDMQIIPESAEEESILNRHLDEIIYFFQSTKYDLVVIEDLDRFNNPDIFVTLREMNSLINANAGVSRKIRFLYALRDNMFVNTDRTKFFEFIIPVIPIINSSNSIDKVIEQGERLSLAERLDRQFLREVSRYLSDLRLIQNIFNEYSIYVDNLDTDDDGFLDKNRLLAILIYKNVLPSDFEELHRQKGKLAEIINRRDEYVSQAEEKYKADISHLEIKLSDAQKQLPHDLAELRKIYAMTIVSKMPRGYISIEFKGKRVPIQGIWNHDEFDEIIEASSIMVQSPQDQRAIDISGVQTEVSPDATYQARKSQVENKSVEFQRATENSVRELRSKISDVRTAKFNEIIKVSAKNRPDLFSKFGEFEELVKFLVLEGFLDDTYYQYTSLFHSGRLSPNDNKYLIQIRSFKNPEPEFQIDNPKEVIAAMREDDFRQHFVLNKTLVDCMLASQNEYDARLSKMVGYIRSSFDDCGAFFTVYYVGGKYVGELLTLLVSRWPGFVSAALSATQSAAHVARILAHLPEADLKRLGEKGGELADFTSNNLSAILALGIDFEPARLALIEFEAKELKSLEAYPAISRQLSDNGQYEISIENIEFIFRYVLRSPTADELKTKHYSTVLISGDNTLISKLDNEFAHYLQDVLLKLDTNSEEDISAIVAALQHEEVESEQLERFVEKQSSVLPSLESVPQRLRSSVFRLRKIEASWQNAMAYMASDDFDAETLTSFLDDEDTVSTLSAITVDDREPALPMRQFLFNNGDFADDTYRAYIRALPKPFKQFPADVEVEKLRILIEQGAVTFSASSFSFLEGKGDLQVLFVAGNIDRYFAEVEKFPLDDEFREKLLSTEIGDDKKLKLIDDMDMTLLASAPNRAAVVGQVFHRTGADLSHLSAEAAQAVVTSSKPIKAQISLLNKCHVALSDDQIRATISHLPPPFPEIEPGWRQPTIPNTPENQDFVRWLESRSIISSSKPTFFGDEIRIYNKRK